MHWAQNSSFCALIVAVRLSGREPGIFSQVSDIMGRKGVERFQLNVGKHNQNVVRRITCLRTFTSSGLATHEYIQLCRTVVVL